MVVAPRRGEGEGEQSTRLLRAWLAGHRIGSAALKEAEGRARASSNAQKGRGATSVRIRCGPETPVVR